MPNKTIYVREEDVPIFERAAELAGSLSAAITEALKEWVGKAETSYVVSATVTSKERADEIARELRERGYEVQVIKKCEKGLT